MSMTWRGPEAVSLINAEVGRRVDAAARVLRDRAKELVSRDQPVRIYGKAAGRSRTGLDPSKPGEPPKKVTGWLRTNIRKEFSRALVEARVGVGVAVPYGKYLELGTRTMEPRPWLSRAVYESAGELHRRFGIGVKI